MPQTKNHDTQEPQKAISPADALPESLRLHYQLEAASCAASGQECIAKLHGLIPPPAFPLQSDPANQKKGFGANDRTFLESFDINGNDDGYDVPVAIALVKTETQAGRFPLVSLIGKDPDGNWGYHTFLCAQHDGKFLLIDPAKAEALIEGYPALFALFANNSVINPERKTIHILTYKLPGN